IQEISPNGLLINTGILFLGSLDSRCLSMSSHDSVVSFSYLGDDGSTNYFYNIFTFQQILQYPNVAAVYPSPAFQSYRNFREMYTLKANNSIDFGRINGDFFGGNPSIQTLHKCVGIPTTLTGNIVGGVGPLAYSWAPATGLNN